MKSSEYKIIKLDEKDNIPFDLLLLADETIAAIKKYIYNADIYVLAENGGSEPVAVFVLHKINDAEIEIKNMAVSESLQGKGIGSYLIGEIKRIAIAHKYQSIVVGTADNGVAQINFYEKNGFTKFGIKKDFYTINYPEPIIEEGILLRDMVMLKMML